MRRPLTVLGAGLALMALTGVIAHVVPWQQNRLIAVGSGAAYLMAPVPVAAALLLVLRRRLLAGVAIVLTAVVVGLWLPVYVADALPSGGHRLTVLSANLGLGNADPDRVVAVARRADVDVVLLQELTEEATAELHAAGLDELLPHHVTDPRHGAAGVGLWSRHPVADGQTHDGLVFAAVSARLDLGQGRPSPTVLTVHLPGPWPQPASDWLHDMGRLPHLLDDLATRADETGSPVLVGGDFNATYDTAQFRQLLTGGYRDAAEQSGSGSTATYPAGSVVPPVIGIDHVLVRGAVGERVTTVSVPGSDHRALLAVVVLPGLS